MIQFEFTDANNKAVALHVRRGAVEYVENATQYYRKPDFNADADARGLRKALPQPVVG